MPFIACPVAEKAKHHPEAVAIRTVGKLVTYRAFDKRIQEYQSGLVKLAPTSLGLYLTPSIDMLACLWALLREGIPIFLMHTRYTLDALQGYLRDMRISHIVHDLLVPAQTTQVQHLVLSNIPNTQTGRPTALCMEATATYMLTSGSSGPPKVAVHALSQHVYNAMGVNETLLFGPTDQWLLTLPLYHVSGLGSVFRCFLAGATLLLKPPGISLTLAIDALRPSHLSVVPYQLKQLTSLDTDTKNTLRCILLGGSSCPDNLIRDAHRHGLQVLKSYGLTEMAATVSSNTHTTLSSGHILPYREVRLMAHGEIAVRGPCLFSGYLNGNYVTLPLTHEGWFLTGDLGRWEGTQLTVLGRKDGLIISGGENMHPEEIEECLLEIPELQQVIVVGMPDETFGERPVAFVHPMLPQDIFSKQLSRLPKHKWPIRFLSLPNPGQGKPSRYALRQHLKGD